MGFLLECLHKIDLGNSQCPNGKKGFTQTYKKNQVDKIHSDAKKKEVCIFYGIVVKITVDWVSTMSGRVLVKLGGGIKKNKLYEKKKKVPI